MIAMRVDDAAVVKRAKSQLKHYRLILASAEKRLEGDLTPLDRQWWELTRNGYWDIVNVLTWVVGESEILQ